MPRNANFRKYNMNFNWQLSYDIIRIKLCNESAMEDGRTEVRNSHVREFVYKTVFSNNYVKMRNRRFT